MTNFHFHLFIIALLSSFYAMPSWASPRQERLAGPISGQVLNILDGDTVSVRLHVWIGQELETYVRIDGIDAPELHGKCAKEREMAQKARTALATLLENSVIHLYNVRLEKYAGRVLAGAKTDSGIDIADYLIQNGYARAYHGKKRGGWCG